MDLQPVMQLNCALLRGRDVLGVEIISVPATASVTKLNHAVKKTAASISAVEEAPPLTLRLTRALSNTTSGPWLQREILPWLDGPLVERGCHELVPTLELSCDMLFDSQSQYYASDIHLIAIVKANDSECSGGPARKRACRSHRDLRSFLNPPVVVDSCVPLDTIAAFQDIRIALTLRGPKPMVLLCGAPSSGKTTISKGIKEWIKATAGPNDQCLHVDFKRVTLDDEATMWQSLCWCMGVEVSRDDEISFLHALAELPGQWHLIVDHMERVLTAPALAACYLNALREAK